MRLDAAEAGVAVTGVPETGHKQPLQGQLTPVCIVSRPCPLGFEFGTAADERGHDPAKQTMVLKARVQSKSGNAQRRWERTRGWIEALTDIALPKPPLRFVGVKRDERGGTAACTTGAPKGLRGDVSCGDDAWEEAGKIQLKHVEMNPRLWIQMQSTAIGVQQVPPRRGVLGSVLPPRDQHTVLHGRAHLNRADDRARGAPSHRIEGTPRGLRQFDQPRQPRFTPEETRGQVDVDTALEPVVPTSSQQATVGPDGGASRGCRDNGR